MKKLLIGAVAVALAAPLAAAGRSGPDVPELQVSICHRTATAARPYVRQVATSAAELRRHRAHPADIVPASGPCPRAVLRPAAGGTALTTSLLGVVERPEPGAAEGAGTATIRLRRGQGQICYRLSVRGIGAAAAAHVHRGGANASGPVVFGLRTPNAAGVSSGCAAASRGLVGQILARRGAYYVNVHTAAFPGGAVRGQLGPTAGVRVVVVEMSGANEVPSADPNGAGTAAFRFRQGSGEVCFTLTARNIRLPAAAAHIHRGAAGQNGGVLIGLTAPDGGGAARGCTTSTAAIVDEILAGPAGFYVNVHDSRYPGGAIRAQLG